MFGKKKDEYKNASIKLNDNTKVKASKRIIFELLEDDDNRAAFLVAELKSGKPLVVNFENLDIMGANKMLAFLSGACYAIEGETVKISEAIYLFARKVDFIDGSLKEFIESRRKKTA